MLAFLLGLYAAVSDQETGVVAIRALRTITMGLGNAAFWIEERPGGDGVTSTRDQGLMSPLDSHPRHIIPASCGMSMPGSGVMCQSAVGHHRRSHRSGVIAQG